MGAQNAVQAEISLDIPRLMQCFESLGENCDLGVVQRAIGIEPFGLFRFSACKAADVVTLLRSRFKMLGEPEDLWLEEVGPTREYWVKSHHSSFEAHTDRFGGVDDAEVARSAQIERIRFLKSHLMRDLTRARRIFVYKGHSDLATIRELVAQMRAYGPATLLWVKVANHPHKISSVKRNSEGLLLGFVSRYGTYGGEPSLPIEEWIAMCANAYRLCRGGDPPRVRSENLLLTAIAQGPCEWFSDVAATTRAIEAEAPAGDIVFEHKLQRPEATTVCGAHLPIDSGGNFVFSAWVRIPEGFRGRQIAALFPGFPSIALWTADVKSRGRWQRVWVSVTLPADANEITCAIIAEGEAGAEFLSASWCLERGSRPLGYGFDM